MERVRAALNSRYFLICIDGIGGIGKTSLALEVIHECLRFSKGEIAIEEGKQAECAIPKFDGFIWTSAKDRELRLNDILDAIARTLDWPGIAQQPYLEKIESVRKLLQTKHYLLIVDNFETITDEAVRDFLLKIPEPSKVLITSREQKLQQAWAVSIKGLEQDEALALIRNEGQRLGLKSVEEADDQVLLRLYQATGGAPLAIKWSVGQIKQKGQSLDTVLAALHEAKGDIFEEVFARSWSLLAEDAQRVLMVMPIFAASASRDAIEAASDVHHFALDEALGQLVQMWMLEVTDELETTNRRYSVHPLTRAYSKARGKGDEQFERIVKSNAIIYYYKFVQQYGNQNFDNYDILESERENIISIIELCIKNELWQEYLNLFENFGFFLWTRGYWQEILQFGKMALTAARGQKNKEAEKITYIGFAVTYLKMGNYEEAKHNIEKYMQLVESHNDIDGIGLGICYLGKIAREQGDIEKAYSLAKDALKIARQQKNYISEIHIRSDIAQLDLISKNYSEAESKYRKSIVEFKKLGLEYYTLAELAHLADLLLLQGKIEEAQNTYLECLTLNQKYGRKDIIAKAKLGLSKLYERKKENGEALNQINEALLLFEKLGMKKYIDESQEMIVRLEKKIRK